LTNVTLDKDTTKIKKKSRVTFMMF